MSISLRCNCGNDFLVANEADGMDVRCPLCGELVQVPSVVEELADETEEDKSRWIHVRCACGFVVMGPRSWAGRKGRCPRCHQPIELTPDVELPMPKPREEFLVESEESDTPFKQKYRKLPGGVATTPVREIGDEALRAELVKELAEKKQRKNESQQQADQPTGPHAKQTAGAAGMDAEAESESEDENEYVEYLSNAKRPGVVRKMRRAVNRANRGIKSLGVATLVTATLTVWVPREMAAAMYLWVERECEQLISPSPPPMELGPSATHKGPSKADVGHEKAVMERDPEERERLLVACILGDLPSVKQLVESGASVKEPDKLGATPLHWAAGSGQLEVVQYLVARGADIDAIDVQGNTPLRKAEKFGHKQVSAFLESVEH